jgi:hypothetical protein
MTPGGGKELLRKSMTWTKTRSLFTFQVCKSVVTGFTKFLGFLKMDVEIWLESTQEKFPTLVKDCF